MSLLGLPNELLSQIAKCVAYSDSGSASLNNFTRTNRCLYNLLNLDLHGTIDSNFLLHWGIENDQINTISLALAHGADPNTSFESRAVVFIAFSTSYKYNAVELAAYRLCKFQRKSRWAIFRPIDPASFQKHYDTLVFLLNSGGRPTLKSVTNAIKMENLDVVRLFAEHGMDFNQQYGGRTLLGLAGCLGRIDTMRLLLELGADVNYGRDAPNKRDQRPPLWDVAVESDAGAAPLVVLLEAGADVQYTDNNGTGFVEALTLRKKIRQEDNIEEKIEVLVRYGAKALDKKERNSVETSFSSGGRWG